MTQFMERLVSLCMAAAILLLAGCGPKTVEMPTSEVTSLPTVIEVIPNTGEELINTQWVLESILEDGVESSSASTTLPHLEFRENGEAGGSGGCNTFSTHYQVQDGRLSFGPVASTKIACAADIMQEEQRFFDALGSADGFELSGDTLRIWYTPGQNVLTFSRTTLSMPTPVEPMLPTPNATLGASGSGDMEQRIRFEPGSTFATVNGNLSAAESDDYIVRALAGQTLSVDLSITEGRAILIIWGQDGNVLISDHADDFSGLLSSMDEMTIRV